jgi:hypothetical protein
MSRGSIRQLSSSPIKRISPRYVSIIKLCVCITAFYSDHIFPDFLKPTFCL